jgi:hypothetical protein
MTAIDRTAYPRPGARLTREETSARYHLADSELAFIRLNARGDTGRLMLATLLKTRQDLGCFTMPEEAHPDTVAYLAAQLGLVAPSAWTDEARRTKSLYRYQAAVRTHLSVRPYDESADRLVRPAGGAGGLSLCRGHSVNPRHCSRGNSRYHSRHRPSLSQQMRPDRRPASTRDTPYRVR